MASANQPNKPNEPNTANQANEPNVSQNSSGEDADIRLQEWEGSSHSSQAAETLQPNPASSAAIEGNSSALSMGTIALAVLLATISGLVIWNRIRKKKKPTSD